MKVRAYLDALQFISFIEEADIESAIAFAESNLSQYTDAMNQVSIPSKNH